MMGKIYLRRAVRAEEAVRLRAEEASDLGVEQSREATETKSGLASARTKEAIWRRRGPASWERGESERPFFPGSDGLGVRLGFSREREGEGAWGFLLWCRTKKRGQGGRRFGFLLANWERRRRSKVTSCEFDSCECRERGSLGRFFCFLREGIMASPF
ncbi:hypothetical protein M5K25_011832 [Dendrobium thyrsiflorum]|uniref:Uncharacterized protein n=1 Tax=Dendrobium thyrsiflorum TaxID=117978 RepID=A0ABD0VB12_DENTH